MGVTGRIAALLGRREYLFKPPDLSGHPILVTGSSGSIGTGVRTALRELGASVLSFDASEGFDLADVDLLDRTLRQHRPAYVIHLAAHKYATTAEDRPYQVAEVNIQATHQLCDRAAAAGVKNVIVASTCKAVEPETVYGASKLVAERIALNHGFTVGRFFNVLDSTGGVFDIWRDRLDRGLPLEVAPCCRYFISRREAVAYIVHLLARPPACRYAPYPGQSIQMSELARRFAGPEYPTISMRPRRGDRLVEPLHGRHESYELIDGHLMLISNRHDVRDTSLLSEPGAVVDLP